MTSQPATEKQIAFINSLIEQQLGRISSAIATADEYTKADTCRAAALWARVQCPADLDKFQASELIDALKDIMTPFHLLDAVEEKPFVLVGLSKSVANLLIAALRPLPQDEPQITEAEVFEQIEATKAVPSNENYEKLSRVAEDYARQAMSLTIFNDVYAALMRINYDGTDAELNASLGALKPAIEAATARIAVVEVEEFLAGEFDARNPGEDD